MKRNLFLAIFKVGWKIPLGYIFWMKRYANNKDKYPIALKYGKLRKLVRSLNNALDFEIHAYGLENIPNQTSAFFSNHLAAVDPFAVIELLDKPITFLAKNELETVPFVSTAINCIEGLYLKRDDLKQSLRTMMKIEEDLKNNRKHWLIFPEGTRNRDDRELLLEFHHGTFRPAMKSGVPIVPVAIFGTQRIFDKKSKFRKYPVQVIFDKPIYPEEYQNMKTEEVARLVQSRIQSLLTYKARKYDRAILKEKLGDNFKENL